MNGRCRECGEVLKGVEPLCAICRAIESLKEIEDDWEAKKTLEKIKERSRHT